jgi:curved DNA-binding protein
MNQEPFVDYYEILQLSPNADLETIERVFRMLAKRYHPDNGSTSDVNKFNTLVNGYRLLSDPEKRAAYDVRYEKERALKWKLFQEGSSSEGLETDGRIQQGILSLLYVTRRRDASNPGMGILELERVLGCPEKHMEFHIWYLKEKGWIERTDNGGFAITAEGVDAATEQDILLRKDRLLPESNGFGNAERDSKDGSIGMEALLDDHVGMSSGRRWLAGSEMR